MKGPKNLLICFTNINLGTKMAEVVLSNAFSLNMLLLSEGEEVKVKIKRLNIQEAKELLASGFKSVIGHSGTAQILSQLLGVPVQTNRTEIKLTPGQQLIVFQLMMRLQEGQVLNQTEIEQLYNQGKAAFYLVQLLS